ncbi:MAG TPA: MFS transporter [Acetobacteraceae bacterium]|jgi:MFS family permease|nr:MFS transporter [Acetobacteraceae bacterium]
MIGLLRLRSFRAFMAANCLERFAAAAMTVLLGFQVYALTHDPLDLGWLGLVEAIPGVTLVLYGGHVADRRSRRTIVVLTTALLAALAAVLAVAAALPPGTRLFALFVIAFLAGIVRAFEGPAATGLEAQVVPLSQLIRGTAALAITGRLADVFGPIAGGFAWTWLGAGGTYAAIAVLFALACAALLVGTGPIPLPPGAGAADTETTWGRIAEGVRYVFRDQLLWGSMALDLFAVFFGGANALLPAFATDILGVGAIGLGLLRAAAGAGSLISALLTTRLLPERRAGEALLGVIAGFGVSMVVFGLSRSLPLSLLALFTAGACDGMSMVIRRAIVRIASPEALRGRIAAVRSVFVGSSNELGAFESGLAAALLGIGPAVWAGGLVTLAVVAATALVAPRLRQLDLVAMTQDEAVT